MDKITRTATLLATVALSLVLTALPALATEGAPEKITLPETEHDRVGLIILGACAVFVLFALVNARKQLKGERQQADGEFRWR
jgi:hypothetical protein